MRINKLGIFIIGWFAFFSVEAQIGEAVRLQNEIKKATSDSARVDLLAALSKFYYSSDGNQAIRTGEQALELARKIKYTTGEAQALNNIGGAYFMLGNFPKAATYHFNSLKIREAIRDSAGLCASYVNLGNVYNYQSDTTQALKFYKKSLEVAQNIQNQKFISMALNNIGNLYERARLSDKAIPYYNQALFIKREVGDKIGICVSLNNLGNIYIHKKQFKKAQPYFTEALSLAKTNEDNLNIIYALRGLAQISDALNASDKQAITYTEESLRLAYQLGSKEEIRESVGILQEIYQHAGDYKNAYFNLSLYQKYGDSIITETGQRNLAEMKIKYETEKKDKENLHLKTEHERHQLEQERNKLFTILGGLAIISISILAVSLFRSRQRTRQNNQELFKTNQLIEKHKTALTLQADLLMTQKSELENSNRLKNKLFSVISHDLRSPINSLRDFIYLLEMKAIDAEEMLNLVPFLKKELSHTANLMDNLLIWTKNQMNNMPLYQKYISLYDIVEENIGLFTPQANVKNISIYNNLKVNRRAFADEEMTKFIVRNLVANAIKFTNQNGIIIVAVEETDADVAISVTDNGKGLTAEDMDKLFQNEYFTTRGTANEKGSGLGLRLCKEFVERNNGTIKVQSTVGKGSTFTFTLPLLNPVLAPVA